MRLLRFWFISTLILAMLAGYRALAGAIWVDDAPDGGGEGTNVAPFHWGNSADRFDAGMRSYGPGTTFHLAHVANTGNTFQTRGAYANSLNATYGFQLKSNQSILGGPGVTLKLVYVVPQPGAVTGYNIVLGAISPSFAGGTSASSVVVQDMTIDCNGPALKSQRVYSTIRGIELVGTANVLRNVTVINAIGDRALLGAYDENFIVSLSTLGGSSTGNLIDHCTVQDFHVDKSKSGSTNVSCSAISLRVLRTQATRTNSTHVISGTIRFCTINLNGLQPGRYSDQEYGINSTCASNLTIAGNLINGASRGFSNDTGPNTCLLISGNVFNQGTHSWGVYLLSSCDSSLESNTFNLLGPDAVAIGVHGLLKGQQATRWRIRSNFINSSVRGNNGIYFYPAPKTDASMPVYVTVEGNVFVGRRSYINVPGNVASGGNYLARNRGAFAYYNKLHNKLSEPVGSPCLYPDICPGF